MPEPSSARKSALDPNDPVLFEQGLVCGRCDGFSALGGTHCPGCGHDLSARFGESVAKNPRFGETLPPPDVPGEVRVRAGPEDTSMEQAKYYVCESCMTPVPSGHKFCGRCGAPVPDTTFNLQAQFFSDMQDPSKARLILIRGEGMDGLSYHLKADQHVVGRTGQLEFPDDPFVSPKHANFFYRDGQLVVRDEGSLNGVYIRVRGTIEISAGDVFLAGEQVFRLDPTPKASDGADGDGTFFYSSPKYPSAFRVNQVLEGGSIGMTVCARGNSLQIGREDGDLNFPSDVFMSAKHCNIEEQNGKFFLTDHNSRNGTYVRVKTEQKLTHGDYVFIGKKLLRVELNVN
jgi:pSer/pThr/pTyr-binding forkhead associated (FHA) protein